MPTHVPQFYKVEVKTFAEASMYLDTDYRVGWRVVTMAPHPDGLRLIFLLEKKTDKQ